MAKNFMSSAQLEQMWGLYAAGETAAAIARRLGRPGATVNDRIREAGGIRPVATSSAPQPSHTAGSALVAPPRA